MQVFVAIVIALVSTVTTVIGGFLSSLLNEIYCFPNIFVLANWNFCLQFATMIGRRVKQLAIEAPDQFLFARNGHFRLRPLCKSQMRCAWNESLKNIALQSECFNPSTPAPGYLVKVVKTCFRSAFFALLILSQVACVGGQKSNMEIQIIGLEFLNHSSADVDIAQIRVAATSAFITCGFVPAAGFCSVSFRPRNYLGNAAEIRWKQNNHMWSSTVLFDVEAFDGVGSKTCTARIVFGNNGRLSASLVHTP